MNKIDRDSSVDIAKGIGIILVVFGHINAEETRFLKECIYQFHVPFFFLISGMLFNFRENFYRFFIKKLNRLYLPAIIWLTIFYFIILTADYYLRGIKTTTDSFIKHNIMQILGLRVNQLGGAMWFLFSLFRSSAIFALSIHLSKQLSDIIDEKLVISILMILAFWLGFSYSFPYSLEVDCIALGFICLGRLYYLLEVHQKLRYLTTREQLSTTFIGCALIVFTHYFNNIDIALGNFGTPPLTICSSITGSIATLSLSITLVKNKRITKILSYIGKCSIWILTGHFVAFKIVTISQALYYHYSPESFFSHPTFITKGYWIPTYLIAGILLPLGFCHVCKTKLFPTIQSITRLVKTTA